ncbi:MAG: flagellar basal-body MS-ring/collar protein FliF [Acidimicrobiales bacterium]
MPTTDQPTPLVRAKELAGKLTPIQKITIGAVLLTVIAGTLVLSRGGGSVPMTALYTDLSPSDAASVVDSLSSQGVAYELADAGKTVMVPKDQVYDLRVSLAGEGLPSSNEGYALLDNQGITTSEFRQRVDYQRALEGELAKTLSALDSVQSASVHLALPDDSVFVDEPATPTASVLVAAKGVGGISGDEVDAIVHLVASAVKDMKPEDVTVIDSNGTVLSAGGDGSGSVSGSGSTERAKVTSEYEAKVTAQLVAMLSTVLGPNKAAITVNASLDLDSTQSTSEDYGSLEPDGQEEPYVLSNSASREQYGGKAGTNGEQQETGVLGPDGALTADDITVDDGTTAAGESDTDYVKEQADTVYGIDRVVEQRTVVPGTVNQINVAVALDEATVTEDQRKTVEEMVKAAVGANDARGDNIQVKLLPFDTSTATEAEDMAKAEAAAESKSQMMGMIRTIAVLFVILVALFLGYKSAKSARKVTVEPINIGEITTGPRPSLGPGSAESPEEALETELIPIAIQAPPDRDAIVMNELTQMADRKPQEVANVLRAWLAEQKQPARR